MAEYVDKKKVIKEINSWWKTAMIADGKPTLSACVKSLPPADVVEKEMILDFIRDNRPTDIQTDWERGCAYICDEVEKLLK